LKVKLDHIGILVEKFDDNVIKFYQETFGLGRVKHFHIKNDEEEINYVYLPFPKADNYIELLAPVTGPSMEALKKKGQGTMFELCVEVDSMKEFYDEMKAKGIVLCDSIGRPLPPEKPYCSIPGDDNKYAYMPADKTYGTTFEILERNTWKRETYWPKPSDV